jgi:hypothetical protein
MGQDCSKRAFNEHVIQAWKFKLLGDTFADAAAGAALLASLAIVNISDCDIADWNGTYCTEPGEKNALKNDMSGADYDVSFIRYVDPTQNALMTSTPA